MIPVENGELILRMKVAIAPELTSWILGFGPDVEVIEPHSLRQKIYDLHLKATEKFKP